MTTEREKYDPEDPIHRLAYGGAKLLDAAPGLGVERVADFLEALAFPERFDIVNGEVVRKGEKGGS